MAVVASRPSVSTTATLIATNSETAGANEDYTTKSVLLKNITATTSVYLGPSGVTTSTGFEWAVADGPITVDLEAGESLYGIVGSGSQTVHTLGAGR